MDGEYWHITDIYKNIQTKLEELDQSVGLCHDLKGYVSERICTIPLQARTEFTPRANPNESSIVSILEPSADGAIPSLAQKMLYEGADVPNPALMIPSDEISVYDIVINRRRELFGWQDQYQYFDNVFDEESIQNLSDTTNIPSIHLRRRMGEISPGKVWDLESLPGTCDGTPTSICGREPSSDCLLYGHMNKEGGLVGNESNGWLVMNLSNVNDGIVMIKFEGKSLSDQFQFDYAIDGKIMSLTKVELDEKKTSPQDKVELLTLLDDDAFIPEGNDARDVKFAVRVKNCDRNCKFKLTHVYWA